MTDLEVLLRLMEVKAGHYWGSALAYGTAFSSDTSNATPPVATQQQLYDAKADALRDFVAEIRADIATAATLCRAPSSDAKEQDRRWIFITEMAGTMTATIKNTPQELDEARAQFHRDHGEYLRFFSNANSGASIVCISPRDGITTEDALSHGILDVRHVLITDVDRDLDAIVCDTDLELAEQVRYFEDTFVDGLGKHRATYRTHEIVIPPVKSPVASMSTAWTASSPATHSISHPDMRLDPFQAQRRRPSRGRTRRR